MPARLWVHHFRVSAGRHKARHPPSPTPWVIPLNAQLRYPALSRTGRQDAAESSHLNFMLRLIIKTSKSAASTDFAEITTVPDVPAVHHGLSVAVCQMPT